MRRSLPLQALLCALLALLALCVALSLPALARAANVHGPKVDDRLAAEADLVGPDDTLDVVVGGRGAEAAGNAVGSVTRTLTLVGSAAAEIKARDLDRLAAQPRVDYVSLDAPVTPTGAIDPSSLATLYPLVDKAPTAWSHQADGTGVGIAVIDSGVAPNADLAGRLVQVPLQGSAGALADSQGHGTLVAGVAAGHSSDGRFVGIAPGATVYALDVDNGAGVRSSDVIAALGWVFDHAHASNIRVVNLSLSETVPSIYALNPLDLAVERLWAAGVVVVVSAGNGGPGLVDFAPANDPLVLTVGALDTAGTASTRDDLVAGFSAVGMTLLGLGAAKPELLAPGRLVASSIAPGSVLDGSAPSTNRLDPTHVTISGTSFAAPQAAGAAADLLQQHPAWSPDQVKGLLVRRARAVSGSSAGALDLGFLGSPLAAPPLANQGVGALVCAPGSSCLRGGLIASRWNSSSWNSSSWSSSSWNSSSWSSSSWSSSSWNLGSWSSSSWNSSSWNSSSWNSSSWNSYSWN